MAIEILGFTLKSEISIGEILAFVALIASPLIFWFGYIRSRKSEQIKIAREVIDRIDVKSRRLSQTSPDKEEIKSIKSTHDVITIIYDLLSEIEYFGYLLRIHEIRDENILKYYIPRVSWVFEVLGFYLNDIKGSSISHDTNVITEEFDMRLRNLRYLMKDYFRKYKSSMHDLED
jgi:hypothetical protein